MGLDIEAYEIISPEVLYLPRPRPDLEGVSVLVHNLEAFAARQDDLEDGRHLVHGRSFEFCAGSYSGYNYWRNKLAEMLGYAGAAEVYERVFAGEKELESKPFVKLICYADNKGVIGPKTCRALYQDFQDWLPHAERHLDHDCLDAYRHFLVAFKLAAGRGCVVFR